jgi:hypothetical protein
LLANKKKLIKMKIHKIGKHGSIGELVRKGKKVVNVCLECGREIKENNEHNRKTK